MSSEISLSSFVSVFCAFAVSEKKQHITIKILIILRNFVEDTHVHLSFPANSNSIMPKFEFVYTFVRMKKIAVIPARYASTRFPGKLMQMLGDKTVIRTVYDNTVNTGLFDEVLVTTDNEIILKEITEHGGHAVMSKREHESGSDRIAEAIEDLDYEIILNVQGDEPFVDKATLSALLATFSGSETQVASLMHRMYEQADIESPNNVKVVVDNNFNALLFSRSVIPYTRENGATACYYKHIGVYAYRKKALLQFTKWQPGILEQTEKLEQLRYLENGTRIKMILTEHASIGIDTPSDLELAKQYLSQQEKNQA